MESQQSKELLKAQAVFLDYPPEIYLKSNDAERETVKRMFRRDYYIKIRKKCSSAAEAESRTEEHMSKFPTSEKQQKMIETTSDQIRKRGRPSSRKPEVIEEGDDEEDELDEEEEQGFQLQKDAEGKEVRVYHSQALLPNKVRHGDRDGPTTGPIKERVPAPIEDLVGDRPPKTLLDLYARWPIADDSDFFLRIERTLPKRYQGVVTTGLVGEIRGRRVSEADIQRMYGGQEYKVTLYGPDPRHRGAMEPDGITPKVKALTDHIIITVPVLPPNLSALPNQEPTPMMNQMNPFGPTSMPPTTTGDAAVVKANAGFFSDAMKMQAVEAQRREVESSKATSHLISFMSDTNKTQQEQLREEMRRKEEAHEKRVAELQAQVEREKAAQVDIATRVANEKDKASEGLKELYKVMGPDKAAEISRLTDYYRDQLDVIRRSHADQMQAMMARHEGDLRRADERLRDSESNSRQLLEQERSTFHRMLEQERSQWTQREAELRKQMEKQTEAERNMAQQRISDMKDRHEAELRQMEKGHERELRTIKEANDTKYTVSEQTHKMTLQHALERLEDAKADVERAREEAEEAKDLGSQLEKMEQQAALLGYEKRGDNEPKTPFERFAATAGAGISQLLSNANEWLPAALAARQESQARAALPQGQQRQMSPQQAHQQAVQQQQAAQQRAAQQQQAAQRRRTSGAEWAAEGVQVRPTPQPEPGFRQPAQEPSVAQEQTSSETVPNPAPVPAPTNGAAVQIQFPEKFLQHFPAEALMGFLQQAENAINTQVEPRGFAQLMVNQFADGAKSLATNFEPKELWEAVEQIPGTESSPLLRRDGKRWMERLFKAIKEAIAAREAQATPAPQ